MTLPDLKVADAVRGHWADRLLPPPLRPYARLARLERPIGWWLLLWPCWWSSALAADSAAAWPNLRHLALFLVGAVAMRGAGCTYNDIVDRDLDAAVERTRSRPIPSGQVGVPAAIAFLVLLALVGLAVLLRFNRFTVLLGFASLLVVAVYPFMKRITDWPQAVLGLAFSWGALMGWAAWYGRLDWPPLLLYAGAILWTVGYDTVYAHQDKEDDALIGVRSTARLFADNTRPWLAALYAAATVLFAAAAALAGAGWPAWLGIAAGAVHLAWQVATLDTADPDNCLARFRSNRSYGALVFAGFIADIALKILA